MAHNDYNFELVGSTEWSSLSYSPDLEFAICTAVAEYIPIEDFKSVFTAISGFAAENSVRHLLFDKRALRTFHQPSMEWYFTEWKPAVKAFGLTNHFKILPELEWFVQSVKAGKADILSKCEEGMLEGITVSYVNGIEEAMDLVAGQTKHF
jgi:hypothetical protein